jgi:broad specificity phosphatase PhoE
VTTRLVLVRHGRPAAGWTEDADPGLDEVGQEQAVAMAESLAPSGPLPIFTSPLRRTRETAAALERRWAAEAVVDPGIAELPTPAHLGVEDRGPWLRSLLGGKWDGADPDYRRWRGSVLEALLGHREDAVLVSHFVAINVAVGAATGDDRVTCFRPDHCSRTVLEVHDGRLRVVDLGAEAATTVQ